MIPFLVFFALLCTPSFLGDNEAKNKIKNAETLLKNGTQFEVSQEAIGAVKLEPNNKKYMEKVRQIRRAASQLTEPKVILRLTITLGSVEVRSHDETTSNDVLHDDAIDWGWVSVG